MPPTLPLSANRRRFWLDQCIGLLLFIATLAVVLSTNDMGFVRDEAFYFRHAETYQDWFVDVEKGGEERDSALGRERILSTWRNNAEHPPLDKILFGWSWRMFGRKLRPTSNFHVVKNQLQARISGLGAAHGFAKDARVTVLRPQVVGQDSDPDHRVIAAGTVTERTTWSATITLDSDGARDSAAGVEPSNPPGRVTPTAAAPPRSTSPRMRATLDSLTTICQGPGPARTLPDGSPQAGSTIRRTGCEAVEESSAYVLSESSAMRAPGAFFAALLVWLLWLTARGFFWGSGSANPLMARPFAMLAAVGYLLIPRAFYHAHLACFDMTIVTLLFATTVLYHTSLRRSRWIVPVAILWGLSLLAKHNALVLPGALMVHWLWDGISEGRLRIRWANGGIFVPTRSALIRLIIGILAAIVAALLSKLLAVAIVLATIAVVVRVQLPAMPIAWFAMLPIGAMVLVAGWPLLWVDTADNFLKWMEFHLHHEHYMQVYFGETLAYPPFPFALPWVLTALSWPLTLLVAASAGIAASLWRETRWLWTGLNTTHSNIHSSIHSSIHNSNAEARSFDRLCLLSTVWPLLLIALPSTPVFGGTKHWFLAYPFMLLLAGRALDTLWRVILASRLPPMRATAAAWLLALLIAAPAAQATWDVHPHGTAYYNELIGGVPGAAKARMQRQFWGGATRDGLAEINKRAKKHARIWFHNSAYGAFRMYQREGWLRRDLSYSGEPETATYGFFHHQRAHDDYQLECLKAFKTASPIQQISIEGVPVLSVYERR